MEDIKIIIVDDHELFRVGIRETIKSTYPDIIIAGEAGTGADFFALLKTVTPDIVLLDIMLPDMNGIEIARRVKTEYPNVKILIVSSENSSSTIESILAVGVEGFISKLNSPPDILVEAVRSVAQGLDYFGRDIAGMISRIYVTQKKTTQVTPEFTEQEKQIIEYCHKGLSVKEVADRLFLSPRTIDWHKGNIFRKLGIKNTIEMVRFAEKHGIINS
jgi:DNA-binding NarL/FixJ family response regulator